MFFDRRLPEKQMPDEESGASGMDGRDEPSGKPGSTAEGWISLDDYMSSDDDIRLEKELRGKLELARDAWTKELLEWYGIWQEAAGGTGGQHPENISSSGLSRS